MRCRKGFDRSGWLTLLFRLISEKSQCNLDDILRAEVEKMTCKVQPKMNVTSGRLVKVYLKYQMLWTSWHNWFLKPTYGIMILREHVPIIQQYSEIQIQTQLDHAKIVIRTWVWRFKCLGKRSMSKEISSYWQGFYNFCRNIHPFLINIGHSH